MWSCPSVLDDAPADPVVYPLQMPPEAPAKQTLVSTLLTLAAGILIGRELGSLLYLPSWLGALLGGAIALVLLSRRRRERGDDRPLPVITFRGQQVELPRKPFGPKLDTVPIRDVLSIELLGGGSRGLLLLRVPSRIYNYPLSMLGGVDVARRLRDELTARLAREPDGEALLDALERREETADRLFARPPRATRIILYVLGAVFVAASLLGAYEDTIDGKIVLMRMGASIPVLVREGEWYRLFTANLLHGGYVHIGFNGLAILGLGYIVERLMGTPRFLVVYLVTGVTGTLTSVYLSGATFSVGASTSVFGLFLAWAYLTLRFNRKLPAGFAMTHFQWGILALNFALPLVFRFIDGWGHAGGAIGGVLVAALMFPTAASLERPWGNKIVWWGLTGVLLVAYAMAPIYVFQRDRRDPLERSDLLRFSLAKEALSSAELNASTWMLLTEEGTTDAELEVAYRAAKRAAALAESGERSSLLDTQATAAFRLGRYEEAVATELEAIAAVDDDQETISFQFRRTLGDDPTPFIWSQLYRFLAALDEPYGVRATDTATVAAEANGVVVTASRPGTWYFGVRHEDRRLGLLQIQFPEPATTRALALEEPLPRDATFELLGVTPEPTSARAQLHPYDPQVDALPE